MMNSLIRRIELSNALTLEFCDRSNRYYGDFHRLLIEVDILIETEQGLTRLRYQRPLKKMAVVSAEIESEKELLIEQFLATVVPYMQQAGFQSQLMGTVDKPGQQVWKRLK